MKKILITGANGQLGRAVAAALLGRGDCLVSLTGRRSDPASGIEKLDITNSGDLDSAIDRGFDFVVNCAGYTAVDAAESDPQGALALNADAVRNICEAIRRRNLSPQTERPTRLIHISTDYVFSGTGSRPYEPDDTPDPKTVYGQTKLLGERMALGIIPQDSVIIRTAWLYSPEGKNFVKTMLRLGREREEIKVVDDQTGSPTSAASLAAAIGKVIFAPRFEAGIFHFTDRGAVTWCDFASAIQQLAGNRCRVIPCSTQDYPTPAHRPAYSVLSSQKICGTYGVTQPHWLEPLRDCMSQLLETESF